MKTIIRSIHNSIPEELIDILRTHKVILAGGAIERLANQSKVNDFDLYFKTKQYAYNFINDMIGNQYYCVCKGPRSLVFKPKKAGNDGVAINTITFKYFKDANEVLDHFDFECCKAAFDFSTNQLVVSPNFWGSLQLKQLIYTGSMYPIGALLRMQKYISRGYVPDYASILRLFRDIQNIDVDQQEVLEEQIGGMYGLEFDIKGMTLDEIINKLDTSVKIQKSGAFVDIDIEDYFSDLFTIKRIDSRRLVSPKTKEYMIKRYCVSTFKDESGNDVVQDIWKSEFTQESEGYESLSFPIKIGKWVSKTSDTSGISFWNNSFEYKLGEVVEDVGHGLHACLPKHRTEAAYSNEPKRIWCELEIESPDDIIEVVSNGNIMISKAKVVSFQSVEPPLNPIMELVKGSLRRA